MNTPMIVLLVILVVMIAAFVALYFMGKKAQARQDEQRAQMDAVAQQVSMLIIDKKKLKMKESGLPEAVISSVPWYQKGVKVPVVKAKVGPQMMTLICDAEIFDEIPVKKEVKATVSGLYITKVKGLRGGNAKVDTKKKKGLRAWALNKRKELEAEKNK
ncbi:hypothetical protein SAMN02910298_02752 [Pseudobutyrivibrio sp. YE44]|uniref:hypothetical protein n=1 Tax=Pseudobutyrivibrio sp. YE44 TaxID=1520802 RepID=UPI00087F0C8B|nr:hypothetical protein [Pseudobutyrivibrio sp. YE44]SDB53718.1 hypothetical protein SAMN02910298_02752 [Pseudobutyrivibrio sp. YE44]